MLIPGEREFLTVFIHEATTDPFKGPATEELHHRDIYYTDLSHLMTAYYRESVPARGRTGIAPFAETAKLKRNWKMALVKG